MNMNVYENKLFQACCRGDSKNVDKYVNDSDFLTHVDAIKFDHIVKSTITRNHKDIIEIFINSNHLKMNNNSSFMISIQFGLINIIKLIIDKCELMKGDDYQPIKVACAHKNQNQNEILGLLCSWYKEENESMVDIIKILKSNQLDYRRIIE